MYLEFSYIKVWITNQSCAPLEIEDTENLLWLLMVRIYNDMFHWNQITNLCQGLWILTACKKMSKNPIIKYRQKLHDSPKKSTANALKMVSNRAIQKLVGKEL